MDMNIPLISVVVPIYNVENYLRCCADTILGQTYENLEVILVDDGSKDGSGILCDEIAETDSRITVYHKENGGLSDARNYGIVRAHGEYITFIDSDDFIDKDYVGYLYDLIIKYGTDMSICQHRVLTGKKVLEYGSSGDECLENKECLERMLYDEVINTSAWAKLYRRDMFENISFPFGKCFEDIGTIYALMLLCDKIAVGYESKYNYIYRSDSIAHGSFKPNKLDMIEMTDKMAEDVLKTHPDLKKAAERRRLYARFSTLNQMLDIKDPVYIEKRSELIAQIRESAADVLKDERTPKRDRFAIHALNMGFSFYRTMWKIYLKVKKG